MKFYLTAAVAALFATGASAQTVESLGFGGLGAGAIVAGVATLAIVGLIVSDDNDSDDDTN